MLFIINKSKLKINFIENYVILRKDKKNFENILLEALLM